MPNRIIWAVALLASCGLLVFSGCALDPMEELSEMVDAEEVATREKAVLELANLRDDRAIEALVEVLESDEDIYDMAGVALVRQGRENITDEKPDPIITMVAGIMNNVHLPDGNRCRAAWVLGEIGDREAIPALRAGAVALLASAAVATQVRDAATTALKKLGEKSEGEAFELPMGTFQQERVEVLQEVTPLVEPEEEEEEAEAEEGVQGDDEEGDEEDVDEGAADEEEEGEAAQDDDAAQDENEEAADEGADPEQALRDPAATSI